MAVLAVFAIAAGVISLAGLGPLASGRSNPPAPAQAGPSRLVAIPDLATSRTRFAQSTTAPTASATAVGRRHDLSPARPAPTTTSSAPESAAPSGDVATDRPEPQEPLVVTATWDVPFTQSVDCGSQACSLLLDVYAPAAPGPWPVVVLLRGGPGGLSARRALTTFATTLASRGLVVLNADYRDSVDIGGGFPRPFDDVACAVRFARANAATWGGDPSYVTLVGHSLGAYVGSVVALSPDVYGRPCLTANGRGTPDAFVGIAGPYVLSEQDVHGDLATVLGGEPADRPAAWSKGDPVALVTADLGVAMALIHGAADSTVGVASSRSLHDALVAAHDPVLYREIPSGDHGTVVDAASADGRAAMSIVVSFARRFHPPA